MATTNSTAPSTSFHVGDAVVNFGQPATIVAITGNGDLVLRRKGSRPGWTADPSKVSKA